MTTYIRQDTFSNRSHGLNRVRIILWDKDQICLRKYAHRLKRDGFQNVATSSQTGTLISNTLLEQTDLLVMDLSVFDTIQDCCSFVEFSKFRGYKGNIVFMTDKVSVHLISEAVRCGAFDFWLKGPFLNIHRAVEMTFQRRNNMPSMSTCSTRLAQLVFFYSAGLSKGEIQMLVEWANGFPRQSEIATRLGITQSQVHKTFSRIYKKLSTHLSIDNSPRLAHLITLCNLF